MFFVYFLLSLICLTLAVKYMRLLAAYSDAKKAFEEINNKIHIQYEILLPLTDECKIFMSAEQEMINAAKELITKAQNFTIKDNGAEYIIAYANNVFQIIKKLQQIFNNYEVKTENFNEYFSKYTSTKAEFDKFAEEYNQKAKKLRHYIDVFPTSLMARFANIKYFDDIYV